MLTPPFRTARELGLFDGHKGGRGADTFFGWDAVLDLAVAAYWRKRVKW